MFGFYILWYIIIGLAIMGLLLAIQWAPSYEAIREKHDFTRLEYWGIVAITSLGWPVFVFLFLKTVISAFAEAVKTNRKR